MNHKEIKNLLRTIRCNKGLTQVDLGKMIGRTQQAVSKIEAGSYHVDLATLRKIAETFNGVVFISISQDIEIVYKDRDIELREVITKETLDTCEDE